MTEQRASLPAGVDPRRWVRLRRRLNAPPQRVFRAWTDPEEIARWLPARVEGGLAVGSRSVLVWPDRRVWWDMLVAQPDERIRFHRPWQDDERLTTDARLLITPAGYGSRLDVEDGPFTIDAPGGLDAWAEAIEWWADALAKLRAHLDFSVDIRQTG